MRTSELLAELRRLGVKLWVDGAELGLSAPKGALNSELVDAIRSRKSELLTLLAGRAAEAERRESAATSAEANAIERSPREGPLPLSFSQRRLWFLDQLEPDSPVYNMPLAWTLRGPLDDAGVAALGRAIATVVERHEVLRTTFPAAGGAPAQVIDRARRISLTVEPWGDGEGARGDEERRDSLRARLAHEATEGFDLAAGPLLRPSLHRISATEHVLSLLVHHIVFDGWSADVFLREVDAVYRGQRTETDPTLKPLEIQYGDFAAWQQQFLESNELTRQLEVHRGRLAGDLPVLALPTDRPRPAVQSYRGANAQRALPAELVEKVAALAGREKATTYMVLLAAYQALLSRWTGQRDLTVGTIVANRTRPEITGLIGFFANTLVLRAELEGDPDFHTLVQRARESTLLAFENQDVPFERLVEELSPERNLSYTPLFQTIFATEDRTGKAGRIGDLELELFELEARVARTDLMFTVHETEDGLEAWAEYATDLFDAETIERLLASFEALLTAAVASPATRLSELELLPASERERLFVEFNREPLELSADLLPTRFEAQVDRTPDEVALVLPALTAGEADESWTYAELDERANKVAALLSERGVGREDLVGVALSRSLDLVATLLAVLKAGAGYVPLDPTHPAERLAYVAEDAGLALCVTTNELASVLPPALPRILLDGDAGAIGAAPSERLRLSIEPTDRAYVIYTSGSTGRPKGVEVEHRSVANLLGAMEVEPGFRAQESWLAVTTPSFDISVVELFLPLVVGGQTIVAPNAATSDGGALLGLLERLEPDVLGGTPATYRLLLLAGWGATPKTRTFAAGEALARDLADAMLERSKDVWNLYGPTEATVYASCARVEPEGPITIGQPVWNTRSYVLDAAKRPTPIGVIGELWVAGAGLARGYLGRPELTAAAFQDDPFVTGERMYRTGDLARWLPSGEIECLGRVDSQVKLRGFRIELGEIESVVMDVEGVRQAVALVREDTPGDKRLTVYLLLEEGASVGDDALREATRRKLPAYMVPAAFVRLESLPHSPSGKVDRKALQARSAEKVEPDGGEYVAPRTETERHIADVWSEVLSVDRVAVDANFFDLGGHSLLLAEAHGRLRSSLDSELTIVELFQYPTIASLAQRVVSRRDGQGEDASQERSRDLTRGRQNLIQRRRIRR